MHKRMMVGFAICILFLLAVPLASSYTDPTENQKIMVFVLDQQKGISEFIVVRDNPFYRLSGKYGSAFDIPDELPENLGEKSFSMKLFNMQGEVIYEAGYYTDSYIPYFEDTARISIYDNENHVIFTRDMSFCNNNRICEPCEGNDCSTMENSATCPDCASGSKDNYCDLKNDGICDPDCNNLDMDCDGCTEGKCYYDDSMDETTSCGSLGGEVCGSADECIGNIVDYDEKGYCCSGSCVDPTVDEEYSSEAPTEEIPFTGGSDIQGQDDVIITDPVLLFSMNYNNSIPIEDESNKILCSKAGKNACGMFERCVNGNYIHSDDEGDECCTGDCVQLSDAEFSKEYKDIFNEDYGKAEEMKPIAPSEEIVVPAAGALQISPLWFLLAIIPLVIIIFIYNAERKKLGEKRKRIDYEYNYYKNYGYNDEQIKGMLAQRGWKKEDIKKMMKKIR